MPTEIAVQQYRLRLAVRPDGPSSPSGAECRRSGSLPAWYGMGPRARQAKHVRQPCRVFPAGPEGQPREAG